MGFSIRFDRRTLIEERVGCRLPLDEMGGLCSRSAVAKSNPYASTRGNFDPYSYKSASVHQSSARSNLTPPQVREVMVKQSEETKQLQEPAAPTRQASAAQYGNNADDFYDGIPRYPMQKSRSVRSIAKVLRICSCACVVAF